MPKQKNYRKLPPSLNAALLRFQGDVVVATVRNINPSELANGTYLHVGLVGSTVAGMQLTPAVPQADRGRYSRWNVEGRELVRRDLPKYEKTVKFEVPCFGDWSNMVTITQYRMVYKRENLPPENRTIIAEILSPRIDGGCVAKFSVQGNFARTSPMFDRELLSAVNLLHESLGTVGVFPVATTLAQFLGQAAVPWQILPAGTREQQIAAVLGFAGHAVPELRRRVEERIAFFESLHPRELIVGAGGMSGYVGASFSDELVLFDNMQDGNAVYILFKNWRQLSQQTKTELLGNGVEGRDYIRIVHRDGWEARVREHIALRRAA